MQTEVNSPFNEAGHILIVDDFPMNRLKLARILEMQGHTIATAGDGAEALEMMRAFAFDVVLLDIVMPVMDGYQVLEQISGDPALRDIPVIVISAVDEIDSVVRCIEMGAVDYLPKPFNPTVLRARLQTSLQRKKLRDLERSYLQQEIMLRQSEKLATLGKLSAGMAHELNNPVAAVLRGTQHLAEAMDRHLAAHFTLDRTGLTTEQITILEALDAKIHEQAGKPGELDALVRNDKEAELEEWLGRNGVGSGWELAPALVNLDLDANYLAGLAGRFNPQQFEPVLSWAASRYTMVSVLREIGEGSGRVAEIVNALKAFTYLDQAPVQNVDIHAGLDNTLIMLRSKLKDGIRVRRDYAENLPLIEARGSELNQVWTNIIDNAVGVLDGQGEITIKTSSDDQGVLVEIIDSGPGIPADIQPKVFDPFFTTKPPGAGTGLGLNISYNIIVQKHHGTIRVDSKPGETRFEIKLPLTLSANPEHKETQ